MLIQVKRAKYDDDDDDDLSLPSRSIQLHLFSKSSPYYLTTLVLANAGFGVSPRNKIGHPAQSQ